MIHEGIHDRFNKAVEMERTGAYPQALTEYFSIIKEDNTYRNAYINMGSLFSRMNHLSYAMECYQKAIKLGEDFINYFNIGCIHYRLAHYKNAIISLEKSKKLNNNFPLPLLVIGLCYSRLGNIKAAESNFKHVLKIKPDNRVSLTALAIIMYNSERYKESLKYINTILLKDPTNIRLRELKSSILYKTGNIDACTNEIKHLKIISNGFLFYDEYIKSVPVQIYTDKYGTLDEKIEFLEDRADSDQNSLISLSLCHLFKGETEKAIDYLMEAKKRILN